MSDPTDPLSWVERAEEDYAMARFALRRKIPFTYSACFHAQQCAEKYLKVLLVAGGHTFSKVHDLLVLSNECAQAGILVAVSDDQLSSLAYYAVRVRYPGEDPTPEEARETLDTARVGASVRQEVVRPQQVRPAVIRANYARASPPRVDRRPHRRLL